MQRYLTWTDLRVTEMTGGGFRIVRPRLPLLWSSVFPLAFYAFWYAAWLGTPSSVTEALEHWTIRWSNGWFDRVFLLCPVTLLAWELWRLYSGVRSPSTEFDPFHRLIRRGRRTVVSFADVRVVGTRKKTKGWREIYELYLHPSSGEHTRLGESSDRPTVVDAGKRVADLIGARVFNRMD